MKKYLTIAALYCCAFAGAFGASSSDSSSLRRGGARWEYAEIYDYRDGRYLLVAGRLAIENKDLKKFVDALVAAGVIDKLEPGLEATVPNLLDALGNRGWELVSKSLDRQVFEGCKTFKRLKS